MSNLSIFDWSNSKNSHNNLSKDDVSTSCEWEPAYETSRFCSLVDTTQSSTDQTISLYCGENFEFPSEGCHLEIDAETRLSSTQSRSYPTEVSIDFASEHDKNQLLFIGIEEVGFERNYILQKGTKLKGVSDSVIAYVGNSELEERSKECLERCLEKSKNVISEEEPMTSKEILDNLRKTSHNFFVKMNLISMYKNINEKTQTLRKMRLYDLRLILRVLCFCLSYPRTRGLLLLIKKHQNELYKMYEEVIKWIFDMTSRFTCKDLSRDLEFIIKKFGFTELKPPNRFFDKKSKINDILFDEVYIEDIIEQNKTKILQNPWAYFMIDQFKFIYCYKALVACLERDGPKMTLEFLKENIYFYRYFSDKNIGKIFKLLTNQIKVTVSSNKKVLSPDKNQNKLSFTNYS